MSFIRGIEMSDWVDDLMELLRDKGFSGEIQTGDQIRESLSLEFGLIDEGSRISNDCATVIVIKKNGNE